ncbi:MAG: tetratricopeptide repeat protein [Thermodesulfovibrionales bacterium]|nr:tetratricopeptide repeat protein [Thermodesulfovibrionales bacterium]
MRIALILFVALLFVAGFSSEGMSYYISCGIEADGSDMDKSKNPDNAKKSEWKKLYDNACTLYRQGKFAEALVISDKALDTAKQFLGETHPDVAITLGQQARIYIGLRQYTKADKMFRQAETVLMKAFPIKGLDPMALNRESIKYPGVTNILINRAEFYIMRAMFREAELSLKSVVNTIESYGNPYGPEMAEALYLFGEMHRTMKMFEEAEQYYRSAMNIAENTLGTTHMNYIKILIGKAANYHTWGKYKDSNFIYRKALTIAEETLGTASKEARLIRENLALVLEDQGLHMDAVKLRLDDE